MAGQSGNVILSREEYLKRYLSSDNGDAENGKQKKKKKAPSAKISRMQIIDVDIEMKDIKGPDEGNDNDNEDEDETPTVAEVIDERPKSVKIREQYSSVQWKRLGQDGNDEPQVHEFHAMKNLQGNARLSGERLRTRARQRYDSDSDCSPPRRPSAHSTSPPKKTGSRKRTSRWKQSSDDDISPVRTKRRDSSDASTSPERVTTKGSKSRNGSASNRHSGSDLSPERPRPEKQSGVARSSDSDFSPPRRTNSMPGNSPSRSSSHMSKRRSEASDHSSNNRKVHRKKFGSQGEGSSRTRSVVKPKVFGASERRQVGLEEDEAAVDVINLRKETKEDKEKERKEQKRLEEKKAKYSEWGKGLEQKEQWQKQLETDLYEMSKPLARYKDDDDLDRILKEQEHEGDPMLEYMRKKKKKGGNEHSQGPPKYNGPTPPPNRFGVLPGYRWDGVDRSNGFEKKYFASVSNKASKESESYLWSVQDM